MSRGTAIQEQMQNASSQALLRSMPPDLPEVLQVIVMLRWKHNPDPEAQGTLAAQDTTTSSSTKEKVFPQHHFSHQMLFNALLGNVVWGSWGVT
jgi:hypothetical protein